MPSGGPPRAEALVWRWRNAAFGLLAALPAVVVTPFNVTLGLALGFGVLPATLLGVLPTRRARLRIIPVGVLVGSAIWIGSLVANTHLLAVLAVFGLAVGAALLVARGPAGTVALNLGVPMVGIGLSFTDHGKGAAVALLIVGGTLYSYAISLLWPEREATASRPPTPDPPSRPAMLDYGIRLGLAGATAATVGFAFGLDHVGWQVAAALIVMRPVAEMQRLRSVGRVVSVTIGAFAAARLAALTPAAGWYTICVMLAVTLAAGTNGSRWYVTPLFTTFIAISLLLYARPEDVAYRFNQRVLETVVGVGIAYLFGLALPRFRTWLDTTRRSQPARGANS